MVGDVRFAGERDGDDLDRLVVVERLQDEAMEVFDVDRGTAAWRRSQWDDRASGLLTEVGNAETSGTRFGVREPAVPVGVERA